MKSRDICVWLDERWYDALSRHLKDESVEDKLGDYLDQLINELVSEQEYSRISQELWQEDQRPGHGGGSGAAHRTSHVSLCQSRGAFLVGFGEWLFQRGCGIVCSAAEDGGEIKTWEEIT